MTSIIDKIRSQGYWRVRIRPTEYIAKRITDISDLYQLVQRLSVDIRGWDFPHVDVNALGLVHQSYVAQEIDWEHFIELWRLYQSGQFAYMGALVTDWPSRFFASPAENRTILIEDAIAKYSEVLEFAARLSASPAGSSRIWIQIGLHGIRGRYLTATSPITSMFLRARTATYNDEEFILQEEMSREQLLAEADQLGLRWARELFKRFNWNPEHEVLDGIRGQFRSTQRVS